MKKSPLILSLILLTGCAGNGPSFDASRMPVNAAKAALVIYRPSSLMGALESPAIAVNGSEKCDLSTGSFFYAEAPAGATKISSSLYGGSVKSSMSTDLKAGQTYYIKVAPGAAQAIGGGLGALGAMATYDDEGIYKIRLVDSSQAHDELRSTKQTMSCK